MKKIFFAFCFSSLCASAATIGWWPLDGVAGAEVVSVTNLVSDSYGTGSVGAFNNALVPVPAYTNAFPKQNICCVDPVSKSHVTITNVTGFTSPDGNYGGYVEIPDNEIFHSEDITIEVFICSHAKINHWQAIVAKAGNINSTDSWGMRIIGDGVTCRFSNENNESMNFSTATSFKIHDNRWHHIALTYNSATSNALLYVDYQLQNSLSGVPPLYYTDAPICIGGFSKTSASLNGRISNVRISDTVLKPYEFLRLMPENLCKSDAFVHIDFEENNWMWFGSSGTTNFNAAGTYPIVSRMSEEFVVTNDVPYSRTYLRMTNTLFLANSTSHKDYGPLEFNDDDLQLISDSFTAECFYKQQLSEEGQYQPIFRQRNGANVTWNLGIGAVCGGMSATVTPGGGKSQITISESYSAADGEWHHAAFVYNAEEESIAIYRDYCLVGKQALGQSLLETPNPSSRVLLSYDNTNRKYFPGLLDEMRITKKVLSPKDFLFAYEPYDDKMSTLGYWRFEDNLESSCTAIIVGEPTLYASPESGNKEPEMVEVIPNELVAEGEEILDSNTKSMLFKTNYMIVGKLLLAEMAQELTIEYFIKFNSWEDYAPVLRYTRDSSSPVWGISQDNVNDGAFLLRVDTDVANNQNLRTSVGKHNVYDGEWHHVALTLEPYETTNTMSKFYIDYEFNSSKEIQGRLKYTSNGKFMMGYNGNSTETGLDGYLDEIRISKGILPVEKFLRAVPVPATLIIIK